jgi:hypothetical protein
VSKDTKLALKIYFRTRGEANLSFSPAPNTTRASPPPGPGREAESRGNRAQSYTPGTQGVGGSAGGHRPFGGAPPPPQPGLRESGGDAPT